MSRYIDADALMSSYARLEFCSDMRDAMEILDNAPSIDIVRCKECKHNPWNADADYTCVWDDDFADRPQTPDDYCSYGEREGK